MFSTPKGTHDLLPEDTFKWQFVEDTARKILNQAHFQEIRTPVFEETALFERGVGESTDIVNKEMYTFQKSDRSLTLRPENTAGVVRAYVQHGMDRRPKPVKLYYIGPMFRYERPQAGRQRQFHQLGLELFGLDTPQSDAYAILMAFRLFEAWHLPGLSLEINNVGCLTCREGFREKLKAHLQPMLNQLCEDCQRRYAQNPLRMLDCKNPSCQQRYQDPALQNLLLGKDTCPTCQDHFSTLKDLLTGLKLPFHHNVMLVRGLDYYTRTVFEITSTQLGAQNTVCGGGRYNGLVKQLGGAETPAVGWAIGLERLISLLPDIVSPPILVYVAADEPTHGIQLASHLADLNLCVEVDLSGKTLSKQLAQANKLKADYVLIQGETERAASQILLKAMKEGGEQKQIHWSQLKAVLQDLL